MSFFKNGVLIERAATTATAAGTTTLTASSLKFQQFTGVTTQSVKLPDATTLQVGRSFTIQNRSTGLITVLLNDSSIFTFVIPGSERTFQTTNVGSTNGTWDATTSAHGSDSPLKMGQSAVPDAKLNFSSNTKFLLDGITLTTTPISGGVPTVAASTLDFQSGATTGATFNNISGTAFSFSATTTSNYRRYGFSLDVNGNIVVGESAQNASRGSLANPGTLIPLGNLPIGYIDVQATASTAFRTAGSSSSIVENAPAGASAVFKFSGGGGGGGSSVAITAAAVTLPYTILAADAGKILKVDTSGGTPGNIQLPTPTNGFSFGIMDIGGNLNSAAITLLRAGTEKIHLVSANLVLEANFGVWFFITDGTDWFIYSE